MNFWSRTSTLFQRCSGRIPATSLVDATHENKKAGSAICDALRTLVTPSLIGSEIRLLVRPNEQRNGWIKKARKYDHGMVLPVPGAPVSPDLARHPGILIHRHKMRI
ncbi:uncharacterized protein [Cherax quadricarinatus]|uniref:uncharacterized protein n=1 Tax=Cherax quadricarinatus TaxID=27406 RepID=UPI00387EAC66